MQVLCTEPGGRGIDVISYVAVTAVDIGTFVTVDTHSCSTAVRFLIAVVLT